MVRAHVLTADPKYLRAAGSGLSDRSRANPVNMCYTTGLGQKFAAASAPDRSPYHPPSSAARASLWAAPWTTQWRGSKDPFIGPFAGAAIFPPKEKWPALEAYWDVFWDPMVCEYTVHRPMAGNAYVWGYLAARPKQATRSIDSERE